eukprot:gene11402-11550_t
MLANKFLTGQHVPLPSKAEQAELELEAELEHFDVEDTLGAAGCRKCLYWLTTVAVGEPYYDVDGRFELSWMNCRYCVYSQYMADSFTRDTVAFSLAAHYLQTHVTIPATTTAYSEVIQKGRLFTASGDLRYPNCNVKSGKSCFTETKSSGKPAADILDYTCSLLSTSTKPKTPKSKVTTATTSSTSGTPAAAATAKAKSQPHTATAVSSSSPGTARGPSKQRPQSPTKPSKQAHHPVSYTVGSSSNPAAKSGISRGLHDGGKLPAAGSAGRRQPVASTTSAGIKNVMPSYDTSDDYDEDDPASIEDSDFWDTPGYLDLTPLEWVSTGIILFLFVCCLYKYLVFLCTAVQAGFVSCLDRSPGIARVGCGVWQLACYVASLLRFACLLAFVASAFSDVNYLRLQYSSDSFIYLVSVMAGLMPPDQRLELSDASVAGSSAQAVTCAAAVPPPTVPPPAEAPSGPSSPLGDRSDPQLGSAGATSVQPAVVSRPSAPAGSLNVKKSKAKAKKGIVLTCRIIADLQGHKLHQPPAARMAQPRTLLLAHRDHLDQLGSQHQYQRTTKPVKRLEQQQQLHALLPHVLKPPVSLCRTLQLILAWLELQAGGRPRQVSPAEAGLGVQQQSGGSGQQQSVSSGGAERTHGLLHAADMHLCLCADCFKAYDYQAKGCPICRQPVEEVIEVVL